MEEGKRQVEKKQITSFEDLNIWKDSMRLASDIYEILKKNKDYSLRDQVQRAVVSILSNIAEGFERQTNKEFIQFLFIAKGSAGELRTQLYLMIELKYLEKSIGLELIERTKAISRMIFQLIKTRRENF